MTLRARFALWVAVLILVGLTGFGTLVYFTVTSWLAASLDDTLRLSAAQLIENSDIDEGRIDIDDDPVVLDGGLTDELRSRGLTIQVFDPGGTLLDAYGTYQQLALDEAARLAAQAGKAILATRPGPAHDGEVRVYTRPIVAGDRMIAVVQVSQSLAEILELQHFLLAAFLLGSPLLVAVAAFGGFLLAKRALAPIDHITGTARRISAEDLSGRLGLPASRDEVGRLAATFDEMLARLDGAFRREKQFTHDAAHELRTPLAAMQSIISVIAERPRSVPEYQAALADLADETHQLSALTEQLLQLARAESPAELTDPVNLSTLVPDVVDTMRPIARAKNLTLTCTVEADQRLRGDTDAVIRLLLNLLDNAIKYTAEGRITVTVRTEPDRFRLTVADTGEGISPDHLEHVFERFYRAEEARSTPGTGLGLAICSDIVRAHRGDITATSTPGGGATFVVTLPRSAPKPASRRP